MGCRIPIRQMPVGILFSKDFGIIGKSEFANPLKDSDIIGNCYGLPNSDSANAGRHTFSQRSPTFFYGLPNSDSAKENGLPNSDSANAVMHIFFKGLRHYWQIGICQPISGLRPFSVGCRIPIRQMPAGILFPKGLRSFWQIGICQPIIGLRSFWQIGICQPIIGLRHYWQIGICQPIIGLRSFWQRKNLPTHFCYLDLLPY